LIALVAVARAFGRDPDPIDWFLLVAVAVAGVGALLHATAVGALDARSRSEADSFARIGEGM